MYKNWKVDKKGMNQRIGIGYGDVFGGGSKEWFELMMKRSQKNKRKRAKRRKAKK